jgi:hypothetical protein
MDRSTTTVTTDARLGRSIRGRVVVAGAGGQTPAAGAFVILTGPAIQETLSTVADELGDYSFKLLKDGDYTVTVLYSDVVVRRGGLRVTASTSTVVDAQLDELAVRLPPELKRPLVVPLRATADAI